jgi:hypothetical protein
MNNRKNVLAALMLAVSVNAAAAIPSQDEVQSCLGMAEQRLSVRGEPIVLLSAERFALGDGRHMLTLGTQFDNGTLAMNPRLYCTIERNGAVSMVQSMPRLPRQPGIAVVAN